MYASKPLQLRYTGIFVSDVAATVSFYERAFGLNLRYLHPSGGYAEMETGDTLLCFVGEEFLDDTKLLGDRNLHANRRQAPASGAQIAFVSHNLSADWNRALQDAGSQALGTDCRLSERSQRIHCRDMHAVAACVRRRSTRS
jgi:lactoylglutathione lyase